MSSWSHFPETRRRRPTSREIRSALAALAFVEASGVMDAPNAVVSEKFKIVGGDTGSGRTEHVTNAFAGMERWGATGVSLAIVTVVGGLLMFGGRR